MNRDKCLRLQMTHKCLQMIVSVLFECIQSVIRNTDINMNYAEIYLCALYYRV